MKVKHFDKMVVIVAVHGERYLGYVNKSDPDKYIKDCVESGEAVLLNDVRIMAMRQMQSRQGIIQNCVAIPPDMLLTGPAKHLRVMPSSWYFPHENVNTEDKIKALLDGAEKGETEARAAEVGIELPGAPLPGLPGPG